MLLIRNFFAVRSLLKKGTDNSVHKRIPLMARIGSVGDRERSVPFFNKLLEKSVSGDGVPFPEAAA
jgi:hypothetical protein